MWQVADDGRGPLLEILVQRAVAVYPSEEISDRSVQTKARQRLGQKLNFVVLSCTSFN